MRSSIVDNGDGTGNVTVFVAGQTYVAFEDHPNFDLIKEAVVQEDDYVIQELFDISLAVSAKLQQLSPRVSVANSRIYLDEEPVDNTLSRQAVRFLDEENEDWKGLVRFYENCQDNPDSNSAEQLYDWLTSQGEFTITDAGNLIGYKGLTNDYFSIHSGEATVDGEVIKGRIPNKVGSYITMNRSTVMNDPANGCSVGLHVGTDSFAKRFGNGVTVAVEVNPRDVVSVPTDCNAEKMRVCGYRVKEAVSEPYKAAVIKSSGGYRANWERPRDTNGRFLPTENW
jgi:hypothetical protein